MTTTPADLTPLRSAVTAPILAPGEEGWDTARQAWNLIADQRPAAVAYADSASDVVAVIDFARERGLRVAPQSTGHAATTLASLDDVILLRTERMRGVTVDPGARRARVAAGTLACELADAAGEHGLAPLGGSSPDVGVVGFSVGGGIGWLSRRYGLASNSVRAAEVATADGRLVRADADQNTDLFWALRGGGGDFGVVTELELELYPVGDVYAGSLMWPAEHGADVMHAYREWIATLPEEMTSSVRFLSLPPIPEVPEPLRGVPVVDVTGAWSGDPAEGPALLEPLRSLAAPLMDTWSEMPAPGLCRIYGDPEEPVPGLTQHAVLGELTAETVDALVELAGPGSDSPLLMVGTRQLGGALGRAPDGAGALAAVEGEHALLGVGLVMAPEMVGPVTAALEGMVARVEPWSTGGDYLNFADQPGDASRAFDADTYARLREVKAAVNPDGLFVAAHPVV
jgi:hypothetical protein